MAAANATGRDMNRYLSAAVRRARPRSLQFVPQLIPTMTSALTSATRTVFFVGPVVWIPNTNHWTWDEPFDWNTG